MEWDVVAEVEVPHNAGGKESALQSRAGEKKWAWRGTHQRDHNGRFIVELGEWRNHKE